MTTTPTPSRRNPRYGSRPCVDHVQLYIEKFGEEAARRYFETDDLQALIDEDQEHDEA
jgi:hypothetical protein